jgi:hypothetical protein
VGGLVGDNFADPACFLSKMKKWKGTIWEHFLSAGAKTGSGFLADFLQIFSVNG